MLERVGEDLEGKVCIVSGSGNVAQFAAERLMDLGARVVTLSDRSGSIHDAEGLTHEKLEFVMDLKTNQRGSLKDYAEEYGCEFLAEERPWRVPCDLAFPSATQNEIGTEDAEALIANGCKAVIEGANMPTTYDAARLFEEARVALAPGKAANAGGVAVSGLEQSQNALRISWSHEEVDQRLQKIMKDIHDQCVRQGGDDGGETINYVKGANLAGFMKLADAMLAYGVV